MISHFYLYLLNSCASQIVHNSETEQTQVLLRRTSKIQTLECWLEIYRKDKE